MNLANILQYIIPWIERHPVVTLAVSIVFFAGWLLTIFLLGKISDRIMVGYNREIRRRTKPSGGQKRSK